MLTYCFRMTVYAFLIHSPESVGTVYYSRFYSGEGNNSARVTRQQTLVRKVLEEKSFQQQSVSHFPTKLDVEAIPSQVLEGLTMSKKVTDYYSTAEPVTIPIPMEGVAVISASELFEISKVAIWRQFGSLLFTIVCDTSDNLTLLSNNMILIMEHLSRKMSPNKLQQRIVAEPEQVEAIVGQYIQNGIPLLCNYALHRLMALAEDGKRPYLD